MAILLKFNKPTTQWMRGSTSSVVSDSFAIPWNRLPRGPRRRAPVLEPEDPGRWEASSAPSAGSLPCTFGRRAGSAEAGGFPPRAAPPTRDASGLGWPNSLLGACLPSALLSFVSPLLPPRLGVQPLFGSRLSGLGKG